jgi:hypothetical protein
MFYLGKGAKVSIEITATNLYCLKKVFPSPSAATDKMIQVTVQHDVFPANDANRPNVS